MASAICALVSCILAFLYAFGVRVGEVNLLALSLAFLALAFVLSYFWPVRTR